MEDVRGNFTLSFIFSQLENSDDVCFYIEMYMLGKFGTWPRVLCKRHPALPIGVSHELNTSRVKVYWPLWKDVYLPRKGALEIDGAAFGPDFPHGKLL